MKTNPQIVRYNEHSDTTPMLRRDFGLSIIIYPCKLLFKAINMVTVYIYTKLQVVYEV